MQGLRGGGDGAVPAELAQHPKAAHIQVMHGFQAKAFLGAGWAGSGVARLFILY
ncbi:hypothetical protein GCM10010435_27530 [Winogradskya consettensis]|uniref:Uncharacterized protein n=1 Tax=Winogradskya consettensis TaxID=113560 RepID=A0A919SCZ1_9ACTN|nr:hypothetical protein Aco04nite_10320 [Actinoplanes consettensis]